jgi:hypothetical protein
MPHFMLTGASALLDYLLDPYIFLCRFMPLPMRNYMRNHYGKLTRSKRRLTVYDQLNPAYAKYYTKAEALELLEAQGFENLKIEHRHGYSWTVRGEKP